MPTTAADVPQELIIDLDVFDPGTVSSYPNALVKTAGDRLLPLKADPPEHFTPARSQTAVPA